MESLACPDPNEIHIVYCEKVSIVTQNYKHLARGFLSETTFDILYEGGLESNGMELSRKFALTTDPNVFPGFGKVQKPGINIISIEFSHEVTGYMGMSHEFLAEYDDYLMFCTACSEGEVFSALMSIRYLFMVQVEDDIEELGFAAWWSKINTNYVKCLKHIEPISWLSSLGDVEFGQNNK